MKKISLVLCLSVIVSVILSSAAFAAPWDKSNPWNKPNSKKVSFYIQINGEQLDSNGNVSGRDSKFYTDAVASSTLNSNLSPYFSIAIGGKVSEEDILGYVKSVPDSEDVFKKVVEQYSQKDAYIRSSNGKVISWSKLNCDNYKIRWYVLKNEDDGWHIDGVIIDLETNKEISIVVPKEDAIRATCVEYDAKRGTFTPGVMNVKPNRPHSQWEGDNHNLVISGFEDVWYTVLDEETFTPNTYIVPQNLMDAATAVSKLAAARLSELSPRLQSQFGRIDSQAYKQEYVSRNGKKTLYVTPFITERLQSRYGVDNENYIWLAMGDSHGNINKVYMMDRKAAGLDNLFDGE